MENLKQFEKQQFISLETFKKNGDGVKTPVWFAQEGETFFIWTGGTSWKTKRVRNNSHVRVVPSKADGTATGVWIEGSATADDSDAAIRHVSQLFAKKYGLMFRVYSTLGALRKMERTTIKINFLG